jgi:antitoxin component of MazEF toxin-antitoxin module
MNRSLIKMGASLGAVVPKGIIEHFGLEVGNELDFRIEKDYIKAIPVHPSA